MKTKSHNQISEKTSSYCIPIRSVNYSESVENISDRGIRIILKTILLTGFRIGEVLNGYYFRDEEEVLYFRSIALKTKKITALSKSEHQTKFLGASKLNSLIPLDVWKSVRTANIFGLDIDEIISISEGSEYNNPKYLADEIGIRTYKQALLRLKKVAKETKVKYRRRESEAGYTRYYIPAFHFYRKLFATELYHRTGKDFLTTVDYMRWKNLNMVLKYVKEYTRE